MNFNVSNLVAVLRDINGRNSSTLTAIEKAQYISTVLGSAIGATLYMPSSPVDIPRNYFLNNHSERAATIIGCVNEIFPVNFDLTMSIADNVYLARYRLVYEPAFTMHMLSHMAVCSDDVVPKTISDILAKVSTEQEDMSVCTRILCSALAEI